MEIQKGHYRGRSKASLWALAFLLTIASVTFPYAYFIAHRHNAPVDQTFVLKLKSARYFQSEFPAPRQTFVIATQIGFESAAQNALGMELRDVGSMATGSPDSVFSMLSHLGGFGEIIWVDPWTNFPIKLPPTSVLGLVVVPRRQAIRAAIEAIQASGGCLVKAGKNRFLIAKVSEKEKYEAAIRALGWLDGRPPPWVKEKDGQTTNKP